MGENLLGSKEDCSLLEITLFTIFSAELENVALNKPATQSSIYTNSKGSYGPEKAVDGDPNSIFKAMTCTHTMGDDSDPYPWWRVDLQQSFKVHKVC